MEHIEPQLLCLKSCHIWNVYSAQYAFVWAWKTGLWARVALILSHHSIEEFEIGNLISFKRDLIHVTSAVSFVSALY